MYRGVISDKGALIDWKGGLKLKDKVVEDREFIEWLRKCMKKFCGKVVTVHIDGGAKEGEVIFGGRKSRK